MNKKLVLSQRKLRVINGVNAVKPKFAEEVNMVIPSQARQGNGCREGVETNSLSPNNNASLERPATLWVEDIVRTLRKQGPMQSMGREKGQQATGLNKLGPLSVRIERQYGVKCWNAKANSGYANQQRSRANGLKVTRNVQRLGVEEPTNKTPLAPRISARFRDEDIVQAAGKPGDNLQRNLQRRNRTGWVIDATNLASGVKPSLIAHSIPFSSARSTHPTRTRTLLTRYQVGVFRGVLMSLGAMSFSAIKGPLANSVTHRDISKMSDFGKVACSHTSSVPTKVMCLHRFIPVSLDKCPLVCLECVSNAIKVPNVKGAVSIFVNVGGPDPTFSQLGTVFRNWAILVNLAPKAQFGGFCFHSISTPNDTKTIAVAM